MVGVVRNESLAGKIIQGAWLNNEKLCDVGFSIIQKYNFKCSICGLQSLSSRKFRDGMMIPVNLKSAGMEALRVEGSTCLCPLCASSLAINWSVTESFVNDVSVPSPGFLINFPHKSQADIIRLATYALVCFQKPNDHPLFSVATDIDVVMNSLSDQLEKQIPIYCGNDADFAKALARLPDEFYEKRDHIIGSLRWWPNMSYWKDFGRYIYEGRFKSFEKDYGLNKKIAEFLPSEG